MIFTGQVRVPEVDHPGVPATFVVEGDQAEVLLDGESLGRWSLFDVHASRLVSAAFSVSLDGDEITFIADEPVDFAYKGVDHMAESWARYKAMTLPRRMVAVGRSRRGTRPSRVSELRDAMLANLEAQSIAEWEQEAEEMEAAAIPVTAAPPPPPPPPPSLTPLEVEVPPIAEPAELAEPAPPIAEPAELAEPDEPIPTPTSLVETAPPAIEDGPTPPAPSRPMRPGPGLVARPPTEEPAKQIPEVDPVDIFRPEPVISEPVESPREPIEELAPESIAAEEPEPAPPPEVPELVREPLDTSVDDEKDETPERLVVDLVAYEVPSTPGPDLGTTPTEARVPALAVTAPAQDRSGIFGAVRAAFVRNKGSHEHEFVEAPGGIGIIRHICSECGYISIGVSESESE